MLLNTNNSQTISKTLLQQCYGYLLNISFRTHLLISILIRLILITYGQIHDGHSEVPYTDIDYKVVTDGARQILEGNSPFARHTYRYSPLLAYMQLPNVLLHAAAGKIIYSCFDIFVALLIYALVHDELKSQCRKAIQSLLSKLGKVRSTQSTHNEADVRNRPEKIARASACFWLYNPLTAVISTRGNGDSFSSFFVILTIYFILKIDAEKQYKNNLWIFVAGLSHGFAIHLRLYPILFSLAYYMCLSDRQIRSVRGLLRQLFLPSFHQILLVLGTLIGLMSITGIFYRLYGWKYLYEAYIYHFVRKDVRHNFSLHFLMQYLSGSSMEATFIEKLLTIAPQFCLIFYLSFGFGQFRQTLPFCIFTLAFVMVTYNSVVTSQYFVWYLALLPICLNNLQMQCRKAIACLAIWILSQGFWLLPAYLLEFKTWNTFYWIGAQSALFFIVNNLLLIVLIQHYSFTSFKVNFKKLF